MRALVDFQVTPPLGSSILLVKEIWGARDPRGQGLRTATLSMGNRIDDRVAMGKLSSTRR